MWQGSDPAGAAGDQPADHGAEGEGAAEARAGAEEGARGGGRARAGRWLVRVSGLSRKLTICLRKFVDSFICESISKDY